MEFIFIIIGVFIFGIILSGMKSFCGLPDEPSKCSSSTENNDNQFAQDYNLDSPSGFMKAVSSIQSCRKILDETDPSSVSNFLRELKGYRDEHFKTDEEIESFLYPMKNLDYIKKYIIPKLRDNIRQSEKIQNKENLVYASIWFYTFSAFEERKAEQKVPCLMQDIKMLWADIKCHLGAHNTLVEMIMTNEGKDSQEIEKYTYDINKYIPAGLG